MPDENRCVGGSCPYEQNIEDTRANTSKILDIINGTNGEAGMKTKIAMIEAWVSKRQKVLDLWSKVLMTVFIGLGALAFLSVLVLAAKNLINFP